MFFLASKLLSFLLVPANWILMGIVLWWFTRHRRRKRVIAITTISLALLASNGALYRQAMYHWQYPPVYPDSLSQQSTIVLLSGMTFSNKAGDLFFGTTADRFIQTARIWHRFNNQTIIISGGDASISQNRPSEAFFLQNQLAELGVPTDRIKAESRSRNTYENALFTRKMLDSLGIAKQPIVLVTSASHLPRAIACFRHQGLTVMPWPANFEVTERRFSWKELLIPDIGVLYRWQALLKEMIGLQVYRWSDKAS